MESIRMVSADVLRRRLSSILQLKPSSAAKNISVPILYLRASEDRLVRRTVSEAMKTALTNLRIVEIEGPHFLLQVAPSRAADEIKKFFEAQP